MRFGSQFIHACNATGAALLMDCFGCILGWRNVYSGPSAREHTFKSNSDVTTLRGWRNRVRFVHLSRIQCKRRM